VTLNLFGETGEKCQGRIQKNGIEGNLQKQLRGTSHALPQKQVCFISHQYSLLQSVFGYPKAQA